MNKIVYLCLLLLVGNNAFCQDSVIIHLWRGKVSGEIHVKHPAVITDNHSKNTIRLTDVTDPVMTIFRPDNGIANGAAVLVCPGGGYRVLAIGLEGYEIAHWLNSFGITAFVLQYRVPDKREGALQDAQRAIRMIRANAEKWHINQGKIGIMGFSAGGSLSARLSTGYDSDWYPVIDFVDTFSSRPDFVMLIYPAYLDNGSNHTLTPGLKVDGDTSPMFIFQTADDPYAHSSLVMADALRKHKVPVEFHLYPKGGHGYGLRKYNPAGKGWPGLAEKWLGSFLSLKEGESVSK